MDIAALLDYFSVALWLCGYSPFPSWRLGVFAPRFRYAVVRFRSGTEFAIGRNNEGGFDECGNDQKGR